MTLTSAAPLNILDPYLYARDPLPAYQWLRDEAPVYWDPVNRIWAISRHEDVLSIERDTARYSSARRGRCPAGSCRTTQLPDDRARKSAERNPRSPVLRPRWRFQEMRNAARASQCRLVAARCDQSGRREGSQVLRRPPHLVAHEPRLALTCPVIALAAQGDDQRMDV